MYFTFGHPNCYDESSSYTKPAHGHCICCTFRHAAMISCRLFIACLSGTRQVANLQSAVITCCGHLTCSVFDSICWIFLPLPMLSMSVYFVNEYSCISRVTQLNWHMRLLKKDNLVFLWRKYTMNKNILQSTIESTAAWFLRPAAEWEYHLEYLDMAII